MGGAEKEEQVWAGAEEAWQGYKGRGFSRVPSEKLTP